MLAGRLERCGRGSTAAGESSDGSVQLYEVEAATRAADVDGPRGPGVLGTHSTDTRTCALPAGARNRDAPRRAPGPAPARPGPGKFPDPRPPAVDQGWG